MQPMHPTDYLWQEIHAMVQYAEAAWQVPLDYLLWFCLTAVAFAAIGLVAVLLAELQAHRTAERRRRPAARRHARSLGARRFGYPSS